MRNDAPLLHVESDYDGYFESLVRSWIARKTTPFNHSRIIISSGPYRPVAVTTRSYQGAIYLDFYSALRAGFGSITEEEVKTIISLL